MSIEIFTYLKSVQYSKIVLAVVIFIISSLLFLETGCSTDPITKVVTDTVRVHDTTVISKSKYGMYFSGSNGYISIPNIPNVTGANSSRMVWIYVNSVPDKQQWIFGQGSRESIIIQDNGKVAFSNLFPKGWQTIEDDSTVPTNRWMHYAAVQEVDASTTTLKLFRDGNLINSKVVSEIIEMNSGCNLFIGGVEIGGSGDCQFKTPQSFSGFIDEVSIWSIPLTKEQINAKMKTLLTSQESGLAAYYSFENNTGKTTTDDSGHNNTGQLSNNGVLVMPIGAPFSSKGQINH